MAKNKMASLLGLGLQFRRKQFCGTVAATAILAAAAYASPAKALDIVLTDIGGAGAGTAAYDGFQQAANIWENLLTDNVTVRLNVGFSSLGSGILGSTSSSKVGLSYSDVRSALVADQATTNDALAVANLQAGPGLRFVTQDGTGNLIYDNNNSVNNNQLNVTRANAKALGLFADDGYADATIRFNNGYSFDFDDSDGLSGFDFVGIAMHEIAHSLGFMSGVDTVDSLDWNLDPWRVFSVLDVFRYSERAAAYGDDVLDFGYGGNPYFSVDGGATELAMLSTGSDNGDGRQASHWKDGQGIGFMDPTANLGENLIQSEFDLLAMDVIGWDLAPGISIGGGTVGGATGESEGGSQFMLNPVPVPEPGSFLVFAVGLAGMGYLRRRRR